MNDEINKAIQQWSPESVAWGQRGVELKTLRDAHQFAVKVAFSDFVPQSYKKSNNPEKIAANVLMALDYGARLGMEAMPALNSIALINGTPCLYGDGLLAICQRSRAFCWESWHEEVVGEGETMAAICTARRNAPNAKPITCEYTMDDAKQAGLLSKDNWKKNPKAMLKWRARTNVLKACYSDLLQGMQSGEEMEDIEAMKVEVVEDPAAEGKSVDEMMAEQIQSTIVTTQDTDGVEVKVEDEQDELF